MEQSPIESLWQAVKIQAGPSRHWHVNDLFNHEQRYLADLSLITDLAPTGAILELGSAPCHMTALLKLSGYGVVGVDIDPKRCTEFIQQLSLDVHQCDIERSTLPFEDETFECVMLCETFEHLRIDPAFVLSEINRVMTTGATLILTTPNVYSLPSIARFILGRSIADPATEFGKLRSLGHMGHVREYSTNEVVRFVEAAGLAVDSISYRSHTNGPGRKNRLLSIAYRLLPRRFRREMVIVARKVNASPGLAPLVPYNT